MSVIKIKRGTTDPTASNVTNAGELAANTSTPKVFLKTADDSVTTPIWVGAQIEATPGDWTSAVKLPTQSAVNTTFMPKAGGTFSSNVSFSGGADIRFIETGGGTDFIAFQGPASIATSVTFTLPSADGTSGQVLTTNGSGTLSWAGASATNVTVLGNNGATVVYPLFATGTGVGVDVYADASTTPLSYYPDTSILKASTFQGNVKSSADDTALTLTGTSTVNEDPAILTLTGSNFPNSTASLSASSITLTANVGFITLTANQGYTLTGGTITHSGSALELPTTYTIQDSATGVNSTLNIAGQSTASTFSKTVNIGVNTASGGTSNVNIATAMNAAGTAAITIGSTAGTSATTLNGTVTVANDIAVNGGDITTTSTGTATVFNTNATTVNLAGAGTTVAIGAATGTATINNATVTLANATALNVNGASPTLASSSTGTLTLFNTNLATVNAFGAATSATLGYSSTGTSTTNISTGVAASTFTKTVNIGTGSAAGSTTNVTIGSSLGTSTVTINGNLTISGTTTTVNTTNLDVQDKNITVGKGNTSDAGADTAGITADATSPKTLQYDNTNTAWTSSENMNVATGKAYKVAGTNVLTATALGSGVVGSSLTSVGTIGTGTWNGTVIGMAYGGSGKNLTAVNGGIVYSDADSFEILGAGTSGYILTSGGAGAPVWTSTITATLTGTASNASAVTMASSTDTTSYLTFVSDATATSQGLKYNSSLLYNATTNYLEVNIDGGTY